MLDISKYLYNYEEVQNIVTKYTEMSYSNGKRTQSSNQPHKISLYNQCN